MRRLARHVRRVCSGLSLLLCVVVCVLWVRSFAAAGDQLLWTRPQPDVHWGPSHYMMGPSPFPVFMAVEKFGAASFRGRLRVRRVSWFLEDRAFRDPLFGAPAGGSTVPPMPDGVTLAPGFAWSPGDALRMHLWLEHRETSALGFTAERGFWQGPFSSGFGNSLMWSAYEQALEVPHWSIALLTAIFPALTLRRTWLRWRRSRAGLCRGCGYDLRASPDRCPECGTETLNA